MVCSIGNRTKCLGLIVCMCVPTSVSLFCFRTRPSGENGCGSTRADRLCWMGFGEPILMKWSIEKFEFRKIRTHRRQPIIEPRVQSRFVWVNKHSESNCRIARIDSYLAFYTCMCLCRYYSISGFDCVKVANISCKCYLQGVCPCGLSPRWIFRFLMNVEDRHMSVHSWYLTHPSHPFLNQLALFQL